MRIRKRGGFTLVEIMVGLAVFGAAILVAVPTMARFNERMQARSSIANLESQLRRARSIAVSKGCNVLFLVLGENQGYLLIRDNEGDGAYDNYVAHHFMHPSVKMADVQLGGSNWLTFNPRGMPDNPGYIRLLTRDGNGMDIRVAAGSGAVSVAAHHAEG
jgi:prepilin-type N-terminal cleavage/methylation domain-containing protein